MKESIETSVKRNQLIVLRISITPLYFDFLQKMIDRGEAKDQSHAVMKCIDNFKDFQYTSELIDKIQGKKQLEGK
jgi:hypothetical protein